MELIEIFKSRFYGLPATQQTVLRSGAVAIGLLLLYLIVIDPVYSGRDAAEQRLLSAREAFSVMQQQAFDLKNSVAKGGIPGSASLVTQVESSAQKEGLRNSLKRLQPSGDNQIQVSLEGASYMQIIRWLSGLNDQGVKAQRVDIQVDRKTDLLGAQLLLVR